MIINDAKNDSLMTIYKIKRLNLNLKNYICQNDIAFFSTNMIF